MSPFAKSGRLLWDRGYSVIPIMPKEKMPAQYFIRNWSAMLSWNRFGKKLPIESDISTWEKWPDANIGIATGEASYLVALDFDDDTDDIHAKIQAVIPKSPVRKVGNRGFTAFYQFNGEVNRTWRKNNKPILELLSTGRQTVLPPSIHPSGGSYHYVTEDTLETTNAADLPTLPDNFIELMDGIFGITTHHKSEVSQYHGDTSVEEVERALGYLSPESYHDWVEIGMSLQAELGDAGLAIWDKWSQGSSKYKSTEINKKYASFRGQGVGIATLFHSAMRSGYTHRPVMPIDDNPFVIDPNGYIGQIMAGKTPDEIDLPDRMSDQPDEIPEPSGLIPASVFEPAALIQPNDIDIADSNLSRPHGLVGEIVDYILATAIKKQPILAVGAALTFVGMVKGHRLQSETKLRTNLYIIGLGESGCGKDHPIKCINEIAKQAGIENLLLGDIPSGPGLLKAIKNVGGRAMSMIDEVGLFVAAINSRTSQSHQKDIITNMMKLYSSTGRKYRGPEYANAGARNDIEDPCYSMFGLSTGGRFWDALSGDQVIDGFLNRIIIVSSNEHAPKKNRTPANHEDVPQIILDQVMAIEQMTTDVTLQEGMIPGPIKPRTIFYDEDAAATLGVFEDYWDQMYDYAHHANDKTKAIWQRVAENAIKIALILQEGDYITGRDMQWACDFANTWTGYTIDNIRSQISDSLYEKTINRLLDIIRKYQERHKGEGIPHADLSRSTSRWLKMKERNDILTSLLDSETIRIDQDTEGQKIKRYFISEQ